MKQQQGKAREYLLGNSIITKKSKNSLSSSTKFAYKVLSSIATAAKHENTMCIWSVFCHDNEDKAMKRMAERKEGRGRWRQEKELLLSLALVAWEAALGHNVWRTSVAVGHKSSAKTADCSQKRRWGRKGEQGEAASGNSGSETVMSSGSQTRESERRLLATNLKKSPAQLAPAA